MKTQTSKKVQGNGILAHVLSSFPDLECPMCGRVCQPIAYTKLGTKYEIHKCEPNDENMQPLANVGKRSFRINNNGDLIMKGLYNF